MPSATPSPSNSLDLVLHIGSGETDATSIQRFLQRNRARLADLGYLYPQTPGRARHTRLGQFIQPDDMVEGILRSRGQRFSSPESFREAFRRQLSTEILQSGLSRVLLSDEALYGASDKALRQLHTFTGEIADNLRLVVYLRRQDDHFARRYQTVVRQGETRRLIERLQQIDLVPTYDYHSRLRTWERLLAPDEIVVRRFERDSFVEGSLYQDFLDAAGIDARATVLKQVESVSESLDAESVEFLRILNLYHLENGESASRSSANKAVATRLAEAATGPTLTAPAEFMALWAESNAEVARDYLRDESGQLFRMPQSTGSTTTEQRLDPARLDHFLALTELPQQLHAPLRAMVEREAKESSGSHPAKMRGPRKRRQSGRSRGSLPPHYDSAAKTIIEQVRPRTMTDHVKLFGLILATRYVVTNGIPGDIVECGVWRGGSMQAAALTLRECGNTSRDLHLYDTFEGMTAAEDVDRRVDGKSAVELLESSDRDSRVWGVATLDDVKAGMREVGYPSQRVHFHVGPVEETLPREAPDSVAVLRLDTDWYASTRHELEHLYDRLSPGGVLIIDDYGYWEGARKATDEFLDQREARLLLLPLADGRIAVKPGLQDR